MKKILIIVSIFFCVGCGINELFVPLKYRPTSDISINFTLYDKLRIYFPETVDKRGKGKAIGENIEEEKPIPVYYKDLSPTAFVHKAMIDELTRFGFIFVQNKADSNCQITSTLKRFWVNEKNTYRGDILLELALENKNGDVVWKKILNGSGKNWGRSLSVENYQETFSNSIVSIVQKLTKDKDLQMALSELNNGL
jgi:hypothetical protein